MRVTCSICLEAMTENSEIVSLYACGHIFDRNCIENCLVFKDCCPLCNQSSFGYHPRFCRVYFSVLDETMDDNIALRDAKAELEAVKAAFRTSKLKTLEERDKMALKLKAKQESIDLLTKNLEISNKKIKSLKDQLDAGIQNDKSNYNKDIFTFKYNYLKDQNYVLNYKMQKLGQKLIDLTLSSDSSSTLIRIHQLEKQLESAKAKELAFLTAALKHEEAREQDGGLQASKMLNEKLPQAMKKDTHYGNR